MKKYNTIFTLTTLFVFIFSISTYAGSGSWNYIVTGQNIVLQDTSNAIGINLYSGSYDDGIAKILWPFNFSIFDDTYAANDTIYISTNGFIRFDGIIDQTAQTGQIPTNSSVYGQFLSYGGDTDGEVQSQMKYKVNGTAPNRVLTIVIPYRTYYNSGGYLADIFINFFESDKSILVQYKNTVTGTSNHADELGINAGDNTFYNDIGLFPTNDTAFLFVPPTFGALDAGITHIYVSGNGIGTGTIAAKLKCFGTNTLTSDSISWSVNSTVQTSYSWTGSLAQTNYDSIQIGSFNFMPAGTYTIKAWTNKPNGATDENHSNDTASLIIEILPYHSLPFLENFEPGFSYFDNATGNIVDFTLTTTYYHSGSQCAYNAHTSTNENILHETGLLDLSTSPHPYLDFYHIAKTEGEWDYCFVEISTDGGVTYVALPDSVYMGNSLDYSTTGYFHEDSYSIWGTSNTNADNSTWWVYEKFDLKDYKVNNVRIRFRLLSDGSENRQGWFIDDIKVYTPVPIDLGNDTVLCANKDIILDAGSGFTSYLWSTGDTTQAITVDTTGYGTGLQTISITATDTNGLISTDTINITFILCTGISEINDNNVLVYPNPTKGNFIVEIWNNQSENAEISIFNSYGQLIEKREETLFKEDNIFDFNTSLLPKGTYFIKVSAKNVIAVKKLVLQ